ncbi:MAG: glycosyltransferase [candidate division KSB1 bacterium]|nr:glycosyltransferase [candidate division KSB1 bacterium]MDZ7300829.1 glycosyltransferase [candidate division KSB1 bacterium]MDZ7309900.1 glycosyltransferase [candidate division KSB1 bacterium]
MLPLQRDARNLSSSSPMVLVGPAFPWRGGIAQYTDQLYLHLREKYPVEVFTYSRLFPKPLFPGRTQLDTSKTAIEVPSRRTLDSIGPVSWWRTAAAIVRCQPRAVVVMHQMPFFAPCLGTLLRLIRRQASTTRQILLCHNLIPHEPHFFDAPLTRYLLAMPDAFLVLSEAVEREVLRFRPDARLVRVPQPIYDFFPTAPSRQAARQRLSLPLEQPVVLFFGLVRAYKGLAILLHAMTYLPHVHLLIAGEFYQSRHDYQRQISELDLKDRVYLEDRYIPNEEVPAYFAAADVVVLPYLSATQSGVSKLAYHFDKPVIVTNVGGLAEEVEAGRTGYVVPPGDPVALAEAIAKVLAENARDDFAVNIREYKKRYSWARVIEAIEKLAE